MEEDDWGRVEKNDRVSGRQDPAVGDDLFVTNQKRLACGIKLGAANAVLIKVNQIGTVTEALVCCKLDKNGYRTVISHRSGETEDTFIADLAVASGAGQIKTGRPVVRRNAKYHQLLKDRRESGELAVYEDPFISGCNTGRTAPLNSKV